MIDIVKLYNPANAAALTAAEIENLQHLTTDQIKELARAYPNNAYQNAYLLIIDSSKDRVRQIPTASSFQNLYNLRAKHGLTQYVIQNFRSNFHRQPVPQPVKGKPGPVLDLSDTELMSLPGFKTLPEINQDPVTVAPAGHVQVKRIKKVKQ